MQIHSMSGSHSGISHVELQILLDDGMEQFVGSNSISELSGSQILLIFKQMMFLPCPLIYQCLKLQLRAEIAQERTTRTEQTYRAERQIMEIWVWIIGKYTK